jgi:hypothetical protein
MAMVGALSDASAQAAPPGSGPTGLSGAAAPLTNLAHLDFLADRVSVQASASHTTYRLSSDPEVGVLWVYANSLPGGTFARVGGGAYDATTNTYGQGAYDADDIARAAVVYLRDWQATGSQQARAQAYQELRGLTYLQTLTGSHAGDVVLWMQPDGSLHPSPTPSDSPNPSDSGASYWLARTLWAVGEGYTDFRDSDPAFAAFLKSRMDLAVTALRRDVLTKYGQYQVIHGVRVPAWLIVDGADASSEAMLGLAAYVQAGGGAAAQTALAELGRGVAEMSAGTTTSWPYRALLPWALSRSDWHAWGAQMSSGLAAASVALNDPLLLRPAVDDAAGFTPQLLTSTGPVNGLLPTLIDGSQIAYGADARVQGLLAVGTTSGRPGIRDLAGIAAGWFFGANPAGVPVYDPATGVTDDGVAADGTVNHNSGAESTIHGLLTMEALDANPRLSALARASASIGTRDGLSLVQAESGTITGNAVVQQPASGWTGESQWSGSYVAAGPGSSVTWLVPAGPGQRLVQPVVELIDGSPARSVFSANGHRLGQVQFGAVGPQGNAPAAGMLTPVDLGGSVPAGATTVRMDTVGGTGNVDALLVMPLIARLTASGGSAATALLTSRSASFEVRTIVLGAGGAATVRAYDRRGQLLTSWTAWDRSVLAPVAPGGFTIVTRGVTG